MATKHIADAEDEFYVVNITPDFCRVGDTIVPFDICQVLTPEQCDYAKTVFARGNKVLTQGSVIKGLMGNAGEGVSSGTALDTGNSKIIEGSSSVRVEGRPVARNHDLVLMNGQGDCGPYNCLGMLITQTAPPPEKPDPWQETKKTITNGIFKSIGNAPKEFANGVFDWVSTFLHLEEPIKQMPLDFPYDNEVEEAVAGDTKKVLAVGSALAGGVFIKVRLRSRGTIKQGRQNIHIEGTNENKVRETQSTQRSQNPSEWKDASQANELTHQAYEYGRVTREYADGSPYIIEHDFGKPVGANGETMVKVHVGQNGQYHGFPSGEKSGN